MSRKTKILIIILSFLFLGWFIFQPLNDVGADKTYLQAPVEGQQIDAAELGEFLDLWSRIINGPLNKYLKQISLSSGAQYPQEISKWLRAQHWSVERFFYDEDRLHGLVDCVNLKNSLDSNISLSKQSQINLNAIIEEQSKKYMMCKYSDEEMSLVKDNLYQISEIFAGRAVMNKKTNSKE